MGNDGGSIPSRHEMVRTKARPKAKDDLKEAAKQDAWAYCALSQSPLQAPLVSDGHGKLYNRESILTYLLDPSLLAGDATQQMSHVTSIKDVVTLQIGTSGNKFICEVTRRDMDGGTAFVYLVGCGHALAKEALDHLDGSACPVCDKTFLARDIIPINQAESEMKRLQERLDALAKEGLTHSGAPARKKKRKAAALGDVVVSPRKASTSAKVPSMAAEQSEAFKSIFHNGQRNEGKDVAFMNRGTASRVG